MIREKSCGAVVFRREGGERQYLLENMRQGHVSLCKGHVEGAETERETARREISEETGLAVAFVEGFRETIEYSPREGVRKSVVFFLAEASGGEMKPQPEEVASLRWSSLSEALAALTYEDDRRVLRAADAFLGPREAGSRTGGKK